MDSGEEEAAARLKAEGRKASNFPSLPGGHLKKEQGERSNVAHRSHTM